MGATHGRRLAALPVQTQQSLRGQATEVVQLRFGERLTATNIGSMLVTAEVRRLVAQQTGIPPPDLCPLLIDLQGQACPSSPCRSPADTNLGASSRPVPS